MAKRALVALLAVGASVVVMMAAIATADEEGGDEGDRDDEFGYDDVDDDVSDVPEEAVSPYQVGAIAFRQRKYVDAYEAFSEAIGEYPQFKQALVNRAATVMAGNSAYGPHSLKWRRTVGDWKPTLETDLRLALELDPRQVKAHELWGVYLFKYERNFDRAIDSYLNALAITPSSSIHYNMGLCFREDGKLDEAADSFEQAVRINPRHAPSLSALAELREVRGQVHGAAEAAVRSLQANPMQKGPHLSLARLYRHTGRINAAHAYLVEALKADPSEAEAVFEMAELRRKYSVDPDATLRYATVSDRGLLMPVDSGSDSSNSEELVSSIVSGSTEVEVDEEEGDDFTGGVGRRTTLDRTSPVVILAPHSKLFQEVDYFDMSIEQLYALAQELSVQGMQKDIDYGITQLYDTETSEKCNVTAVRNWAVDGDKLLPKDYKFKVKNLIGSASEPGQRFGSGSPIQVLDGDLSPALTHNDDRRFESLSFREHNVFRVEMEFSQVAGAIHVLLLRKCAIMLTTLGQRTPLKKFGRYYGSDLTPTGVHVKELMLQRVVQLSPPESTGLYGWMTQELPRLIYLRGVIKSDPSLVILVSEQHKLALNETLDLLDFDPYLYGAKKEDPKNERHPVYVLWQHARELVRSNYMVTVDWRATDKRPGTEEFPPRDALRRARSALVGQPLPLPERPYIVYITRNQKLGDLSTSSEEKMAMLDALGRRKGGIKNEDEVIDELKKLVHSNDVVVWTAQQYVESVEGDGGSVLRDDPRPESPFPAVPGQNNTYDAEEFVAKAGEWREYVERLKAWKVRHPDLASGPSGTMSGMRRARDLFSKAKAVVGVHGDDMANILFCAPGTPVVEVAYKEASYRQYAYMAAALDLDYWAYTDLPANAVTKRRVTVNAKKLASIVEKGLQGQRERWNVEYEAEMKRLEDIENLRKERDAEL